MLCIWMLELASLQFHDDRIAIMTCDKLLSQWSAKPSSRKSLWNPWCPTRITLIYTTSWREKFEDIYVEVSIKAKANLFSSPIIIIFIICFTNGVLKNIPWWIISKPIQFNIHCRTCHGGIPIIQKHNSRSHTPRKHRGANSGDKSLRDFIFIYYFYFIFILNK